MRFKRYQFYWVCLLALSILALFQVPSLWAAAPVAVNAYGVETENPYVVSRSVPEGESQSIDEVIVPGRPPELYRAPRTAIPMPDRAAGTNSLSKVPAFDWSYGCSATAAAMMFGYYDNSGYPDVYTGPTNGGVVPMNNVAWGTGECPLSATHQGIDGRTIKGHVDDYWIEYGSTSPDPFIGNWTEHTQGECTGDYMGTNKSKLGNTDGATTFYFYTNGDPLYDYSGSEPAVRDGCHGMKLFFQSRGYTVKSNYSQYIKGYGDATTKGFTFAQYKAEIDAGRPVLIQVEGHTMLGFGYEDTGAVVYLHDTWDHSSHSMTWGGAYSGMQHYGVTVFVPTAVVLPPTLTVTRSGTGSGTVTSAPAGIDCGETCSTTFTKNTQVTLAAAPATGSYFSGWSGACTGVGTCKITMSAKKAVGASFTTNPVLTVTKSGTGAGTVTSSPAGIDCGETCSAVYVRNTLVTLTPAPAQGSYFSGWTGACTGLGVCRVNMTIARTVGASFTTNPVLTVTKSGTGSGTVTSSPAGISCGETCSAAFAKNTLVTLSAMPEIGSAFTRWTGACTGAGVCRVNMNAIKSVTAVFSPATCTYVLAPGAKAFTYSGGSVKVAIVARGSTNCAVPTIAKEGDWITPSEVTFDKTKGSITITAAANTSSLPRTGKVTVGGKAFPISQTAQACTMTLNPTMSEHEYTYDTGSFTVTTNLTDCAWTARTPNPWVALLVTSGQGSTTFEYDVKENTGKAARSGAIILTLTRSKAVKSFTVKQGKE